MDSLPIEADYGWQDATEKMKAYSLGHVFGEVSHEMVLKSGDLGDVLSDVVRQYGIDLIVIGTHGRHGFAKIVLGSTAERIFRTATCPVLTVGPKAAKWSEDAETPKRIVFATDFSAGSLHALPYALSLAEESQAEIVLLHLITLVPIEQDRQAVEECAIAGLKAMIPAGADAWCKPEMVVRCDFPAEGILRLAEERRADLIVMGVHRAHSPRLEAHAPWATAYEVVCRAPCPVLTVRN
jgi:nucleotide-binding universal stress UspA family protein